MEAEEPAAGVARFWRKSRQQQKQLSNPEHSKASVEAFVVGYSINGQFASNQNQH
jgi:hypothetical protein